MQPLDTALVLLFLVANIAFGLWQSKSNKSTGDYFLGGHSVPWIVAMLSIVATETSVLTFVSVPGLAYRGDWSFLQLPLGYIVGRVLVSMFLLPLYFREGVSSIYEIIGRRFGTGMQKLASVAFLITRILGDGVRFLATGVVVQAVTGWSLPLSIVLIGVVTLIYTISGGLKSVVWLDSFQFGLYFLGGVISISYLLQQLDAPFPTLFATLHEAGKLQVFQFSNDLLVNPMAFGAAFLGGVFLSFASHGVDFMMVQRVLGCRSLSNARKAMIASGFFVFFQFAIFLLAGSLMFLFMEGREVEKDREFAFFIVHHLPTGLKGILLAGILSAAMSTIASSINSLAASTVTDMAGGKVSLTGSRWISFGWSLVLIAIALLFDESNKAIIMVGLEIASFTYGGLLSLFLLSRSSRAFHPVSLAVGFLASMAVVVLLKYVGLAWSWYILLSVLLNVLLVYGIDIVTNTISPKRL
uniref:Sodium:solute symporter family protein n=1 Tax=Chlorobium chlorochromatii (strain CaD3) TaxID=340177 RepID=Q3AU52_CHLCH